MLQTFLTLAIWLGYCCQLSTGHGRLMEPPSRSSMWRFGYNTPINYDDNQLYCGGFNYQWYQHGGKCGICGDPWLGPRPNEAGGKYATGILTRTYTQGQTIEVKVELTAHHKGWFQFKICPNNDVNTPATQVCLDRHVLRLANDGGGSDQTKYVLPVGSGSGWYSMDLVLPEDLTCEQCVLQWRYHAGNNWDCEPDGRCCTGCGLKQEEFYGCSDVRIVPNQQPVTPGSITTTSTSAPVDSSSSTTTTSATTTTTTEAAPPSETGDCRPVGVWQGKPGMVEWCIDNCLRGYCPATHCKCFTSSTSPPIVSSSSSSTTRPTTTTSATTTTTTQAAPPSETGDCRPVGVWQARPGMVEWCIDNCQRGYCPPSYCKCEASPVTSRPPTTTRSRILTTILQNYRETTFLDDSLEEDSGETTTEDTLLDNQSPGGAFSQFATQSPGAVSEDNRSPAPSSERQSRPTDATTRQTSGCIAVGVWKTVEGIPEWCVNNCALGYCPEFMCFCTNQTHTSPAPAGERQSRPTQSTDATTRQTSDCIAVGVWKTVEGIPEWCVNNCALGFCPEFMCFCINQTHTIAADGSKVTAIPEGVASVDSNSDAASTSSYDDQTHSLPAEIDTTSDDVVLHRHTTGYSISSASPSRCHSGVYTYAGPENTDFFLDFYCQSTCSIGECPDSCVCVHTGDVPQQLPCLAAPEYAHLPHMDMFCSGLCNMGVCPQQCICITTL